MSTFPFRCAAALLYPSLAVTGGVAAAQRPAAAGGGGMGMSVAPVMLALPDGSRTISTIVTNPGSATTTVQARLYAWTTAGEEDLYASTREIGFSPAVFRLAPKATQAVRLVSLVPAGPVERAYRLILDQLPLADAPGQLQMPVRMVLPVFVAPATGTVAAPVLEWTARFDGAARRMRVACINRGTGHARIVDLSYRIGDGTPVPIQAGLAGYALAGQRREWSVAAPGAPAIVTIMAETGAQPVRATIAVGR